MESEIDNNKKNSYKSISFLTDFGLSEECAAVCKGVIFSILPGVRVIDITHMIPPFDVRKGAFVLSQAVKWIDANAHLAIVDPGVGSKRRALILETKKGYLVGPDNGLLIPAAVNLGGIKKAVEIQNNEYFLPEVSTTFHGRDIFSPVTAHLLTGVPVDELGPEIETHELSPAPWNEPRLEGDKLLLEIIDIDNFGSVRLNYYMDKQVEGFSIKAGDSVHILIDEKEFELELVNSYSDLAEDKTGLIYDSTGCLTIFTNKGSAASKLKLPPGGNLIIKI